MRPARKSVAPSGPAEGPGPVLRIAGGQTASGQARQARAQSGDAARSGNLPPPANVTAQVGIEPLQQPRLLEDRRDSVAVASPDLGDDEAWVSHWRPPAKLP